MSNRIPLMAGNWKMNLDHLEANHLVQGLAMALADSDAFSVIGGGDSATAVRTLGFDVSTFSHISTGGGASLELLEGKTLPGIAVLED